MTALLLPDHHPMMAASIVDAPNVEGIVNNPVTRHLQRLDGQVDIAEKFPFACGRHADIYLGILRGGLDLIGPGVLTDKAISSHLMGPEVLTDKAISGRLMGPGVRTKKAPLRRVPMGMQQLPVWQERWFRNIAMDRSQPMQDELKSQAHSTVPEYQVPFVYPSPGDSCSLSPENRASFENLAIIPDEGHSSDPDENVPDNIILPSNPDHSSSDAQIRSLLGVPSVTASTLSCNSRRGSPLPISSRNIAVGTVHVQCSSAQFTDNVMHQGGRQSLSRCPLRGPNSSNSAAIFRSEPKGLSFSKSYLIQIIRFCKSYVINGHFSDIQTYCPCSDWLMTQRSLLLAL